MLLKVPRVFDIFPSLSLVDNFKRRSLRGNNCHLKWKIEVNCPLVFNAVCFYKSKKSHRQLFTVCFINGNPPLSLRFPLNLWWNRKKGSLLIFGIDKKVSQWAVRFISPSDLPPSISPWLDTASTNWSYSAYCFTLKGCI